MKNILFLICFFFLIVSPVSASTKGSILQMTSTLENSDINMQYNYAENLGDGRGITFGCVGFCTGTYDGNKLIKYYTKLKPNNSLKMYIPALDRIDAAGKVHNPSVKGLNGFMRDVKYCKDPKFKEAQLYQLDLLYYNPAFKMYKDTGCNYPLTLSFFYDMYVRHGSDGAQKIIKSAGKTPKQGMEEKKYLAKLIILRDADLKNEGLGDVDRDAGYKNLLKSGNVYLKTPFKFIAYGDTFRIDGNIK